MNQRFSITPANAAADLRLTDSVHRTLSVIGIYGDKNGWCWPSQSTLAKVRGVSRKTINLHIKDLIAFGYLNIAPRYDDETGAQKSNMMQIKFDFEPDVTGGVTSKRLQGGGNAEGYTPHNTLGVTHKDPVKDLIKDPVNEQQDDSPIRELVTLFKSKTHLREPLNGKFETNWLKPLVDIYKSANNDFDVTKLKIEQSIDVMKEKGYTIASPVSIQTTAVNLYAVGSAKPTYNENGSLRI